MSITPRGPVVLIIMDGVGLSDRTEGNAVKQAHLETLNHLMNDYPIVKLGASGRYVGVPDGEQGNSEVGHNAIGAGQIIPQGPLRIRQQFDSGAIFTTDTWHQAVQNVLRHHSTLHFIGIFSDGNVHGDIHQLFAMLKQAQKEGISRVRVHPAFDGRDVPPQSAEKYVKMFEDYVISLGSPDYKLADGGGRMTTWADRYENDWGVVENGWNIAVRGQGREFTSATEAIQTLREQEKPTSDQYLSPFVLVDDSHQPIGTIKKGDTVIFTNFRADRAIMSTKAFVYHDFPHFNRGSFHPDDIFFAGITEYDADHHVPAHTLVSPMSIENTLTDFLIKHHISEYAISETVKYGHITYYFDGNHYLGDSENICYNEIASDEDTEGFVNRPWMKSAEITDDFIKALKTKKFQFLRLNYPNGDMVGHFAQLEPTIVAVEAVDINLKRILAAVDELEGVAIITADHGNAEELIDENGEPKTSHTTNKVPCIIYDNTENRDRYILENGDFGLANLASTIATLLGLEPDSHWEPPIIA